MVTTVKDTDTHHGKQVVSSVRVIVDTTEECSRSVLADVLGEEMTATRVFFEERGNVVDETGDNDEGTLDALLLVWKKVTK